MPSHRTSEHGYSIYVGLIFVFNLIVGTGALTLPSIFHRAGWILSTAVIIVLAFISGVTSTFVIESIACSAAISKWKSLQSRRRVADNEIRTHENADEVLNESNESENDTQGESLLLSSRSFYRLDQKIEMGEMASIFFNDAGRTTFYVCFITYLYGDLSIYSAAVAKSLRDVFCHSLNASYSNNISDNFDALPCWPERTVTRLDAYRFSLVTFAVLLGPFVFFNVQKTKYIQVATAIFRWFAFLVMITIAVVKIFTEGPQKNPPMINFNGLPALFGACVYSFMCHHSLPSLIAPINNKSHIKVFMGLDYLMICSFYVLLAITGVFAFANLEDLYTLNFIPKSEQNMGFLKIIEYFLALFPVFTLSASFPVIAITLKNNLQTLFSGRIRDRSYSSIIRRVVFPLLAISPPIIVTFFTESVTNLVSFTGSYAGTSIQYFIPAVLVYLARKVCKNLLGDGIVNKYRSPFQSKLWIIFVIIWASGCLIMVTIKFSIG
ncbi:transmembrane protein 104 homolog isoform X2 [Condylostylus longicornis]|uniref:transmembrane protein 104 homolog isoform X2 n=1 Tax=Condylostylus longicornis TaxID=2530218 RepID=UPI00244DA4B6|nr:transmembrane protein 104 homolog isoform X2 [Condylostylus longicornis]